ncbi:MAG: hypothetical protein ACO3N7_08555, partial [Kiritimatiellia bacterium]
MGNPRQQIEQRNLRQVSAWSRGRTEQVFHLSPNDVLVQIALPLVLILAIASRLLMATSQQGPAVMDLWKQYLMVRIDAVTEAWVADSKLTLFPSADRIQWQGFWPVDSDFAHLCSVAGDLENPEELSDRLLAQVLSYVPVGQVGDAALSYHALAERYPDMALDPARREFALEILMRRQAEWKSQIEDLQWSMLSRCLEKLPADDPHLHPDPGVQLRQ